MRFASNRRMRPLRYGLLALAVACGPRVVEVRTAPPQPTAMIEVANGLAQAVNVYVTRADSVDLFIRQIPARSTLVVPVSGVPTGSTVTLKARTVDGSRLYSRNDVVLGGTYRFPVP